MCCHASWSLRLSLKHQRYRLKIQNRIVGVEQERLCELADGKDAEIESAVRLFFQANSIRALWVELSERPLFHRWPTFYVVVEVSDNRRDRYLVQMAPLEVHGVNYVLGSHRIRSIWRDSDLKLYAWRWSRQGHIVSPNWKSSRTNCDKLRFRRCAYFYNIVDKALLTKRWRYRRCRIGKKLNDSWLHDRIVDLIGCRLLDCHGCDLAITD